MGCSRSVELLSTLPRRGEGSAARSVSDVAKLGRGVAVDSIAQKLRKQSSLSERRMWTLLRPFRDRGYHFRKQVQIGPYVADFVCHHALLVIEVDGDQHGAPVAQSNDAVRDDYVRGRGYRILRIASQELFGNRDGVYALVETALVNTPARARGKPPPELR
jgi:very-short-patch-repair endonuclease